MVSVRVKVLLTDIDDRLLRKMQWLVANNGYEVFVANTVEKTIFYLKSNHFDLVLLDLSIPDLNVIELVDSFYGADSGTTILISGNSENYDAGIEAVRRGAYDFLIKPYQTQDLLQSIRQSLENSAQIRLDQNCPIGNEQVNDIYHFMIENSQDIQYILDHEGRFSFINKRVETLLGYRRSELLGKHYSEIIYDEDVANARYRLDEKRRNGIALRSVELRFKSKNSKEMHRYFDIKSTLIPKSLHTKRKISIGGAADPVDGASIFGVARDVSERKKIEQIVNRKASYDHLTGLPNKLLFYDRLQLAISRAKREGESLAVMYLDLDGFKLINDIYGHHVGDKVLQAMSVRMQKCLRESDTLARIGGDEFTLLLPQVKSHDEMEVIASKLTKAVNRTFSINGKNHLLSVSIGIALYPDDCVTCEALIQSADHAMYEIKNTQKNGYRFYSAEIAAPL